MSFGSWRSRRPAALWWLSLAIALVLCSDLGVVAARRHHGGSNARLATIALLPSTTASSLVPASVTVTEPTIVVPPSITPTVPEVVAQPEVPSLLGKILFISNRSSAPPEPTSGPVTPSSQGYELWVMNSDGSEQRQLTFTGANTEPTMSPDGTHIAWVVGNSPTSYDVWAMASDGTDKRKLTATPGIYQNPRWSPDGRRIAYVAYDGHQGDVVLVDPDGGNTRRYETPDVDEYAGSWSPDSAQLAINVSSQTAELLIMDIDTGNEHVAYQGPVGIPAWSPDGSRILYSDGTNLFTVAPDGTGPQQLTSGSGQHLDCAWSRDGAAIAFAFFAGTAPNDEQIYLMNADGSDPHNITNSPGANYEPTF